MISLFGQQIKVKNSLYFDYTLYFDAAEGAFFFEDEYRKRQHDIDRMLFIRLRDGLYWEDDFYKRFSSKSAYNKNIENNLIQFQRMFSDYKIALIYIEGFDIPAVREIFERINQEGKDLKSMDLMIARSFQNYQYMVEEDL